MLAPPVDRNSVIPLAGLCMASSVCMCDLVCMCLHATFVKRARESFLFIVLVVLFYVFRIFSYLCHISTLMSELKVHCSLKGRTCIVIGHKISFITIILGQYHPTKIVSVTGLPTP